MNNSRPSWKGYKKGDIIVFNQGEKNKIGCIVGNDLGSKNSPLLTIALIKIKKSDLPTHVYLVKRDLLRQDSYIMCEHPITIEKKSVLKLKTKLTEYEMNALNQALKISFGL